MAMPGFITALDTSSSNITQVAQDMATWVDLCGGWDHTNQVGLRMRAGADNPSRDACGLLTDRHTGRVLGVEADFTEWCPGLPQGLIDLLSALERDQGITLGRARFMRCPSKAGLTMHADPSQRFHLAVETNPNAIMGECFRDREYRCVGYHIPGDGRWYRVDTRREHFIYNGGWEPRIHLVACARD